MSTRKFLILPADELPNAALTWDSPQQKRKRLRLWRLAMFAAYGEKARVIRVTWVLSDLFGGRGYAFPSDAMLARETALALNKLEETLTLIDRGGGIARVHRIVDGEMQRHIYPLRTLLPPELGGMATPQHPGGQKKIVRGTRPKPSLTLVMARADAERREARQRDGDGGSR